MATKEYVDLKNQIIETQVKEIKESTARIEKSVDKALSHAAKIYEKMEVERNRTTDQEARIQSHNDRICHVESKFKDINKQIWVIALVVVGAIIKIAFFS